jgi:hypothetical protein
MHREYQGAMLPFPRMLRLLPVLVCLALVGLSCRTWTPLAVTDEQAGALPAVVLPAQITRAPVPAENSPNRVAETQTALSPALPVERVPAADQGSLPLDSASLLVPLRLDEPAPAGEPAGCLAANTQATLTSVEHMLDYANVLLALPRSLQSRRLPETWNVFTRSSLALEGGPVLALDVADVQNEFLLQRMLDSLHVAGFVTWLRVGPVQDLHIVAIALREPGILQSDWAGYVQAYWQDRTSLPPGDPFVIAALKLPPCAWMVAGGFAPQVGTGWWPLAESQPPDLLSAGAAFLAGDTLAANRVARQLDWLGWDGIEAANTMCGPLTWAILQQSGALPADIGGWSRGPETFWLADPRTNGRPWSLFPSELYRLFQFEQPLGDFDFTTFPLYPGDVLYTHSKQDGFDHMLVVTELDENGGRYTVTNLVQVVPISQTTIERALLYNPNNPEVGLFKNEWRRDRQNGRTGHDGFDVFRWAWLDKDVNQQAITTIVQPGDTLGRLALKWRTPPGWIALYNQMQGYEALSVGQPVNIPPNAIQPNGARQNYQP